MVHLSNSAALQVQDFTIQDLILTASPSSVFAALELEAIITATDDSQPMTYSKTLFSDLIPGAGYGIHDIMSIGASLTYTVIGSCAFSGSASMQFGANASLPDSAQIVADYKNHGASSTSGFDSTQVTPLFRMNNESASMNLNAISQPAITFGVDLMKAGKAGMTISVNLPELSTTLSIEHGTCLFPVSFRGKKIRLILLVQVRMAHAVILQNLRRRESKSLAKLVSRWT